MVTWHYAHVVKFMAQKREQKKKLQKLGTRFMMFMKRITYRGITMNGKTILYIDQYGNNFWAKTVRELREQVRGACSKMYRDKADGSIMHVGYVIGQHWLTMYAPVELPA